MCASFPQGKLGSERSVKAPLFLCGKISFFCLCAALKDIFLLIITTANFITYEKTKLNGRKIFKKML